MPSFLTLPFAGVLGAIIGSFLTVLTNRIPPLILGDDPVTLSRLVRAISWPGSHCPCCHTPIAWSDNIPVISYLRLGGHCRACGASYGVKYLMLESLAAGLGVIAVAMLGWSGEALLAFLLMATLLALTAIDMEEQLLPDVLVMPLLPLGILFQAFYRDGLISALCGMGCAFAAMWGIGALYKVSRGRDGLGFGDVKLAAVLGAWLGLPATPFFLTGAFAVGLVVMVPCLFLGRVESRQALPFGPFLALSAIPFLLYPALLPLLEALFLAS